MMILQKIEAFVIVALLISGHFAIAQNLERRASWDAKITAPKKDSPGAVITSLSENSPLQKVGFLVGDIILNVNGIQIIDQEIWSDVFYSLRADKPTEIEVLREHRLISETVNFNAIQKEVHEGIETLYEEVTSTYGITQRTIITKPNKKGMQPAIVLIGGLSCSSIETYPGRKGNWVRTIKDLVEKSNMVVMRVEKPGVGDSEGSCSKSDFMMDLAGYRAAILSLKSKPYVNSEKIVVYGSSMGSALAPLLANEFHLAGVISDGTFYKTWYEHMLEIERRIRQFEGDSEAEIVRKLNNYYIPLYHGMLIEKKTYKEITNKYPALKPYNYHGAAHMYGRPIKYYQQLQNFNLAEAWEKVKVPVRILRGTNDWIMSSFDNQMILNVLKRNGHNDHILLEYPGLDHWNTIHKTARDSYDGKKGKWDERTVMQIVEWAQEIVGLYP